MEFLHDIFSAAFAFFNAKHIYIVAAIASYLSVFLLEKRLAKINATAGTFGKWIGFYYFTAVLLLINLLEDTFWEALRLLDDYPSYALIATLFVLSNIIYVAAFGYSIYRLLLHIHGGLLMTKVALATVPFFYSILPFVTHALCASLADLPYSFAAHFKERPLDYDSIALPWSLPWLLYFFCSNSIKKSWKIVEDENQGKEK